MNNTLLRLYYSLPRHLRAAAVYGRGLYLRSWRYGSDHQRLVDQILERDSWSESEWARWQEDRLAYMLHRAATRVPYYRRQWSDRRRRGDRASWECLDNWPILEKDAVRADPRAFVADDHDVRRMMHVHTSGSTGKPVSVWWSRASMRALYALMEARCRVWNGTSVREPWATVGGQLVTDIDRATPPFWVWNGPLNQLYMSSYHLAPALVPHYLDAMEEHGITHLYAYTSSLHALAQGLLSAGRTDLRMKVVCTNAEPLYPHQRDTIQRAFQCPVRETYGMAEAVVSASEDACGNLRLWPELGRAEIVEGATPVEPGVTGDIVGTSLLKEEMPFIRYRVGDRGALAASQPAACGKCRLPVLASVEGRIDDLLYTAEGRRVGRLDPVFKSDLPIREAQIVQESIGRIIVSYVPAPGAAERAAVLIEDRLTRELRARMGNIDVAVRRVDALPRGPNGKLRAVVCKLSDAQKQALASGGGGGASTSGGAG